MRATRYAPRVLRVLAATLVMTGTLAGIGSASALAAGCQSWVAGQPPSPGSTDSRFRGVAVLSACNAWAVGSQIGTGPSQTLIEHWDGSSWSVVPSPNPGASLNLLNGVRAVSSSSVWAVGRFRDSAGADRTLIEHWNGTTWSVVPSPGPVGSELTAIRFVSARGAWAVGETTNGTTDRTLILRWNGTRWRSVASPDPGTRDELFAVAATSPANAWAAGSTTRGGPSSTLILHWNGKTWTRSRSPVGGAGNDSFLLGLAATSSSNALAVGGFAGSGNPGRTLVLRWTGSAWRRVPSPDLGPSGNTLYAVAASSAGNAWAVGIFRNGLTGLALAIHCC